MRKKYKDRILGIMDTMFMAHNEGMKELHDKAYDRVLDILAVCQEGAIAIGNAIEDLHTEETDIISELVTYCEMLYEISLKIYEIEDFSQMLDEKLLKIQDKIINEIKVHYEVVFLPYKSSMWDSLESIWRAASEDENCICHVIPIPYFDKNPDGTLGKRYYEGYDFPDYVPITSYSEYNLEENMPDVIYYHNPYDEYNRVTNVHPDFYSSKLKDFCNQLVYVPYFIAGHYKTLEAAKMTYTLPGIYADKMIVQSQVQAELLKQCDFATNKILPLGTPKADAVINGMANVELPKEWEAILKNRTVFFVNTSIDGFLNAENWKEDINDLVEYFEEHRDCAFIWRPHPLLRATVVSMRPDLLETYDEVYKRIQGLPNAVVDQRDSAYPAMKYSDALISDYSSIIMQCALIGKPILSLEGKQEDREKYHVCGDYYTSYFVNDGMSVGAFCDLVREGLDDKKEERQRVARESLINGEGNCGAEIHKYMMSIDRVKAL